MTDYVLEILDGDRAHETIPLGDQPLSIGRRPTNELALADEKVSGKHAEIALEDGAYLLRDLGSTNGTLIDGQKVTEVGLSPGDIVHFGRIRILFKRAGDPTPEADTTPAMRRLDSGELKSMRRGGGVGLLLVLVLLLGGGGYWYFQQGGKTGGATARPKPAMEVEGNLLEAGAADFESEEGGWELAAGGSGFSSQTGRRLAHSGSGSLVAEFLEPEDGGGKASPRFALARSAELTVVPGMALELAAHLRSSGAARGAVRIRLWSTSEEVPKSVCVGTTPTQLGEGYNRVALATAVPKGFDRAAVELLALFSGADDKLEADDVALTRGGEAQAIGLQTPGAQLCTGNAGGLALEAPNQLMLTGLEPIVTDPALLELQRAGLICLSDAGGQLSAALKDGKLVLDVVGESVSGLRLVMVPLMGASGVLVRKGAEQFTSRGASFEVTEIDQLLAGTGGTRMLLRLDAPSTLRGEQRGERFILSLPATRRIALETSFTKLVAQVSPLKRQVVAARRDGRYKLALDKLRQWTGTLPHDTELLTEARQLRQEILAGLEARLAGLEKDFVEARFFRSLSGYRRVHRGLEGVVETYGDTHLPDAKLVTARLQRAATAIAEAETEAGKEAASKLQLLAKAYEGSGSASDQAFAGLIRKYIKEHLPAATGSTKEEGK